MENAKTAPRPTKWAITLAGALVVLANLGYYLHSQSRSAVDVHVRYGEPFGNPSLVDLDGHQIAYAGKWTLIVSFDPAVGDSLRLAKYAQVLQGRYSKRNLQIIGAAHAKLEDVRNAVRESYLTYPVVSTASERISPPDHYTWVLLVDPSGTLRFSSDFVEPNDLRMIVERFLLDHISYDTKTTLAALAAGDAFPEVAAVNLKTPEAERRGERDLQFATDLGFAPPIGADTPLVVFSARCSKCSLESAFASYAAWEKSTIPPNAPVPALLFISKFTRAELRAELTKHSVRAAVWHARAAIPGLEDPYSLDGLLPFDVLAVSLTSSNKLIRVEPWDQFVNRVTAERATAANPTAGGL